MNYITQTRKRIESISALASGRTLSHVYRMGPGDHACIACGCTPADAPKRCHGGRFTSAPADQLALKAELLEALIDEAGELWRRLNTADAALAKKLEIVLAEEGRNSLSYLAREIEQTLAIIRVPYYG